MTSIGQRIRVGELTRAGRSSAGITQERLAEIAGVSYQRIRDIECSGGGMRLATAIRIATACGMTVSEWLGQTSPELTNQERAVLAALRTHQGN